MAVITSLMLSYGEITAKIEGMGGGQMQCMAIGKPGEFEHLNVFITASQIEVIFEAIQTWKKEKHESAVVSTHGA